MIEQQVRIAWIVVPRYQNLFKNIQVTTSFYIADLVCALAYQYYQSDVFSFIICL